MFCIEVVTVFSPHSLFLWWEVLFWPRVFVQQEEGLRSQKDEWPYNYVYGAQRGTRNKTDVSEKGKKRRVGGRQDE